MRNKLFLFMLGVLVIFSATFSQTNNPEDSESFCKEEFKSNSMDSQKMGKKIAFFVGVNSYKEFTALEYAVRDSEKMAELFRSSEEFEVILINDNTPEKPTEKNVKNKFCEIIQKKPSRFVFYFSGHGLDEKGDDKNSILLKDVELEIEKDKEKNGIPKVKSGYLSLFKMQKELEREKINSIFLVDACRSAGRLGKKSGEPIALQFGKFEATEKVAILTSSQEGVESIEDNNLESGVFTHFLYEGIAGELQSRSIDKKVRLNDTFAYVHDKMEKYFSKKNDKNTKQSPDLIIKNKDDAKDIILMDKIPLKSYLESFSYKNKLEEEIFSISTVREDGKKINTKYTQILDSNIYEYEKPKERDLDGILELRFEHDISKYRAYQIKANKEEEFFSGIEKVEDGSKQGWEIYLPVTGKPHKLERRFYSFNGDLLKNEFFSKKEKKAENENKNSTEVYSFDINGKETLREFYDSKENLKEQNNGVARIIRSYDPKGNILIEERYDKNQSLVGPKEGKEKDIARISYLYEKRNSEILLKEKKYFDKEGNPKADEFGVARILYDRNDEFEEISFWGISEAKEDLKSKKEISYSPIEASLEVNEKGEIISETNELKNPGNLIVKVHKIKKTFSANENWLDSKNIPKKFITGIEYTRAGGGGKFFLNGGIAKVEYKYDGYGNLISTKFLGEDKSPVTDDRGVHEIISNVDKNCILKKREKYSSEIDKDILSLSDMESITKKIGNSCISVLAYKKTPSKEETSYYLKRFPFFKLFGVSTSEDSEEENEPETNENSENNAEEENLKEESKNDICTSGVSKKDLVDVNGFGMFEFCYDKNANLIEERFYDKEGNLKENPEYYTPVAVQKRKYKEDCAEFGDFDCLESLEFFDKNENRKEDKFGVSVYKKEWTENNHRMYFLNKDLLPVVHSSLNFAEKKQTITVSNKNGEEFKEDKKEYYNLNDKNELTLMEDLTSIVTTGEYRKDKIIFKEEIIFSNRQKTKKVFQYNIYSKKLKSIQYYEYEDDKEILLANNEYFENSGNKDYLKFEKKWDSKGNPTFGKCYSLNKNIHSEIAIWQEKNNYWEKRTYNDNLNSNLKDKECSDFTKEWDFHLEKISKHILEDSKKGEIEISFYNSKGEKVNQEINNISFHKLKKDFDSMGRQTLEFKIDANGNYVVDNFGVGKWTKRFDENGNLVEYYYFGVSDSIYVNPIYSFAAFSKLKATGNQTTQCFYDTEGKPIQNELYNTIRVWNNSKSQILKKSFLVENKDYCSEKPKSPEEPDAKNTKSIVKAGKNELGISSYEWIYDENTGRLAEEKILNEKNELKPNMISKYKYKYSDSCRNKNEACSVNIISYDSSEKPVSERDIIKEEAKKQSYPDVICTKETENSKGLLLEKELFSDEACSKRTNDRRGVSLYSFKYDSNGNKIFESFYDKFDSPKPISSGMYRIESKFNDKNILVSKTIFTYDAGQFLPIEKKEYFENGKDLKLISVFYNMNLIEMDSYIKASLTKDLEEEVEDEDKKKQKEEKIKSINYTEMLNYIDFLREKKNFNRNNIPDKFKEIQNKKLEPIEENYIRKYLRLIPHGLKEKKEFFSPKIVKSYFEVSPFGELKMEKSYLFYPNTRGPQEKRIVGLELDRHGRPIKIDFLPETYTNLNILKKEESKNNIEDKEQKIENKK